MNPRFEIPFGPIDGFNTSFTVSNPYVSASVIVYTNSVSIGAVETNPVTGSITLSRAPNPGTIVQVFYLDSAPDQELDSIKIEGKLVEQDELIYPKNSDLSLPGRLKDTIIIEGYLKNNG